MELYFVLAVVFALVNTGSLLAKNEGLRGAGRVSGGLSWIFFGAFLLNLPHTVNSLPHTFVPLSVCLVVAGIVTAGSGVRKFLRRNPQ